VAVNTLFLPPQDQPCRRSTPCRFISLANTDDLASLYMPFIKQGGVFIPTTAEYDLGERVFIVMHLPDKHQAMAFCGTVIWITPSACQAFPVAGIGIQLIDRDHRIKGRLDQLLAENKGPKITPITL